MSSGGLFARLSGNKPPDETELRKAIDAEKTAWTIEALAAASKSKKRKHNDEEQQKLCLAPSAKELNVPGATADNLFCATYDDSKSLGTVLARLKKFGQFYELVFRARGADVWIIINGVMMINISVPVKSFVQYSLMPGTSVRYLMPSAEMARFAEACSDEHSLTFARKQNGENTHMELQLWPRDARKSSGTVIQTRIAEYESEYESLEPAIVGQWTIRFPMQSWREHVRLMQKESDDIAVCMNKDCVIVSARVDGRPTLSVRYPCVTNSANVAPGDKKCVRYPTQSADKFLADRCFGFSFLLAPVYLEGINTFSMGVPCNDMRLTIGMQREREGSDQVFPSAVKFVYSMRSGTQAPFTCTAWIAPKYEPE